MTPLWRAVPERQLGHFSTTRTRYPSRLPSGNRREGYHGDGQSPHAGVKPRTVVGNEQVTSRTAERITVAAFVGQLAQRVMSGLCLSVGKGEATTCLG